MIEWDFAYTELNNREVTAVTSHGIMEALNMPEAFKEWILNEVPAEKVVRFLEGLPNARQRTDSAIQPLPDDFSEWLYDKISSTRAIGGYDS